MNHRSIFDQIDFLPLEDLHVQLEEDEHESFVLSTSSSQAGEAGDQDFYTSAADDNRETWGSNTDFLLSIIGFAVDLANVWSRKVLEMQWSDGLHDMGYPKWQLVVCLMIIYCLLYISLFKGVKSSGKVVWVTATMPYVVLTILLIRGLMLPGAISGISYYLQPELSKLKETQVTSMNNKNTQNLLIEIFRDCIITTIINCFTSFFSGFVIFTYLGYMSYKQGVHISTVATEGPGLVFQVYPEAVATLPGSQLWSILFFFMLIMLGVDSACVVMFGLFHHQSLQYNEYFYPPWAEWVGWGLTLSSIIMIPLFAIIQIIKTKGTFKEVRSLIDLTPTDFIKIREKEVNSFTNHSS
ncbi:unnamed protein product [Phaedon cochleariae]|uniref:Uncharacterized protein n=1 Tax=Phaedon cochleariae TaxID=80249 RepID=A0A9N9S8Z5_PHACE|nr:unnamed protein product [Phaedon cochleariae]